MCDLDDLGRHNGPPSTTAPPKYLDKKLDEIDRVSPTSNFKYQISKIKFHKGSNGTGDAAPDTSVAERLIDATFGNLMISYLVG